MTVTTQDEPQQVTEKVDGSDGQQFEAVVRKWNGRGYMIQNLEVDGSEQITLVFRKVFLFESYC